MIEFFVIVWLAGVILSFVFRGPVWIYAVCVINVNVNVWAAAGQVVKAIQ